MKTKSIIIGCVVFVAFSLAGCSCELTGIKCENDNHCPVEMHCTAEKVCERGASPGADGGLQDVPVPADSGHERKDAGHPGKDAGADGGVVADAHVDSGADAESADVGRDTGVTDTGSDGPAEDVGRDAGEDSGGDSGLDGGCVPVWTELHPQHSPTPRESPVMVYHANAGHMVMFGGATGGGQWNDETWLWDGNDWVQYTGTPHPDARYRVSMAYDSDRKKVVMFGGCSMGTDGCGGYRSDTWEWDGSAWTQLNPTHKPQGRYNAMMAYDSKRKVTVMFGGCVTGRCDSGSVSNEIWEWDGTDWTQKLPANPPTPRGGGAAAYDQANGYMIVYGGYVGYGDTFDETYTFDGTAWTKANPITSPGKLAASGMAYDTVAGRVTMFGGYRYGQGAGPINETWVWSGSDWEIKLTMTPPPPRAEAATSFDSKKGKLVVFGGYDQITFVGDTWEMATCPESTGAFCALSPTGKGGDMCVVPEGPFMMGCNGAVDSDCKGEEYPYHSVNVPGFWMDDYEVTVRDYAACVTASGCTAPNTGGACNYNISGRETHPINCVDWNQAKAYCAWAGKRLPTEAEWEKAARGTDGRKYPWGNTALDCDRAAHSVSPCSNTGTVAVGGKPLGASPYGVEDMIGNVWEWVEDWYHDTYAGAPADGSAWVTPAGTVRLFRGGAWGDFNSYALRASYRQARPPETNGDFYGFRCALSK